MAEHLFIRISPQQSDTVSWIVTDGNGRRSGLEKNGSMSQAAEKVGQRKVVLMAPGTEITHARARVPLRSGSKLRQAIPYALEDQLAEDVENLHFAIGKRTDDGEFPVAITTRNNMQDWLAMLEDAGIRARAIVADTGCVPQTPGGVTVIIDNDLSYVHGPGEADLVLEGMNIDQVLELAGVHVGDEKTAALPVNLYLTREDHDRQSELIEFLSGQLPGLHTRVMVDGSLAHLAAGMFSRDPINLRQGEFAPRSSPEKIWKPWRLTAGLAAAVLLVLVGGEAAQLVILKQREKAMDQNITAAFREVFPDVTLRGDPANQMRSELAALRAAAGNADAFFLEALAALASATQAHKAGQVDSISFRNGVLDLKILVPSVEVLDRIRQSMEAAGNFDVQLESANPTGDLVEGRIQLRRASA